MFDWYFPFHFSLFSKAPTICLLQGSLKGKHTQNSTDPGLPLKQSCLQNSSPSSDVTSGSSKPESQRSTQARHWEKLALAGSGRAGCLPLGFFTSWRLIRFPVLHHTHSSRKEDTEQLSILSTGCHAGPDDPRAASIQATALSPCHLLLQLRWPSQSPTFPTEGTLNLTHRNEL